MSNMLILSKVDFFFKFRAISKKKKDVVLKKKRWVFGSWVLNNEIIEDLKSLSIMFYVEMRL